MDEPKSFNRKSAVFFLKQQTWSDSLKQRICFVITFYLLTAFCWIRGCYGFPVPRSCFLPNTTIGGNTAVIDWVSSPHQPCEKTIFLLCSKLLLNYLFAMTTEAQEIHYIIAITAKKPPQFHLLYSKKKKNPDHSQVSLLNFLFLWNWVESLQKVLKIETD